MGKIIAVIGNVGVGKTTFARQLCAYMPYTLALEDHSDRPFHTAFATNRAVSALQNQLDFLLLRAEQEHVLRSAAGVGVVDGGLEQDFFVFTRYFAHAEALSPSEYQLCERLYRLVRRSLRAPDLVIYLTAPLPLLFARHAERRRPIEVIGPADIPLVEDFVRDYLHQLGTSPLITVDASADDPSFTNTISRLREPIEQLLGAKRSG